MHSRKFPRLDEGMYDRSQSRSYQVSGKSYSKERVYERGERDHSPLSLDRAREREIRDRDRDGRDRYYNRSSPDRTNSYKYSRSSSSRGNEYMEYRSMERDRDRDRERDRERERLERPSRPLDRMDIAGTNGRGSLTSRSKDSYGRVSPHEHPTHRASSSTSTNHHGGTSTLASTVVPRSRDPAPCASASTTSHSSRAPVSGSSFPAASSSSASSSNRATEAASGTSGGASASAATADIPKKALRVSGDWSEYISSSGKRYYYNCKTEVSQWEKPKDWHAPPAPPPETKAQPSSSGGKYVSSAVTAPHHRSREEVDARESRLATGATSATRPPDVYPGARDYPRDSSSAAPRYASREASPSAARYASASGRDRDKEAREASQHGHPTDSREIVRDAHGREGRFPSSDQNKLKDAPTRSSASMSAVFRAGSKRPATSPNAKERSVSPDRAGRHGSRGYAPAGAENASRSRPRGDDRARAPIASVVASSSHPQVESDSSPTTRDHEESQHHRHRQASESSPVRHVIESSSQSHALNHPNHVPSSSSGTNPTSSGREVVRERDRERDRDGNSQHHHHHHQQQHHSHHQSESRRSLDSSSASNSLSRLGKTFNEGGGSSSGSHPHASSHHPASSGPTGHSVSDPHHPSSHQTHHSSASAAAALSQQPAVAPASQSGGANSCPPSSDANLTTQQALQTLQQALIMAKGGKNTPGGEMPASSAAASSLSHPSTSTMSHASMRPNSSSNGINANLSTGSAVSRLSPGTASDDRNRVPQPSQALPFQSMSNTSTLSQASLSLNSTTTTVPRTSGLASLGGGAGQLAHHSSSREAAPETRTSHTSIALSGIQALNNKLSAMTQISPSLAQYYKEELIAHIMGWQADAVEKQASQIAAESLNIGALNCTRVSGDLKAARSLVRVHDILSTLQEQRLKVVKAWMKDLDYFPHVAGIPFHPPSSSPNSVGIQNGLPPPPHSGSLPLTNGLTPFIPPPSSTGVGWGTPSSLPPILTCGLNTPADPVLTSPTSSAAPPPPLSLPPSFTSAPPPPSCAVVKHENNPSADVTANSSSSTTKPELNSFKKERSLSSSNDSTLDPHRPTQSTQQQNPPFSSRRMSGGNDSAVGVKHKMEQSIRESTPIDCEEKKCGNESQLKTEVKREVKTELKIETEVNFKTTTTSDDVVNCGNEFSASRSRSNSGDGKTNSTFQLKINSGNETLDPSCRQNDDKGSEDETIPASKKTKLNNGEAVKKEGNKGVRTDSESTSLETGMDLSLERSADAAGQSSDSCLLTSPMDRRSASPDEECRPKLSLNDGGNADAAVAEGSPADDISTTDLIPNGNMGDGRLAPSPTTVVAN